MKKLSLNLLPVSRSGWISAAVIVLATMISMPLWAEPPGGRGGPEGPRGPGGHGDRMQGPPRGGMGMGMLLRSEEVRAELGISEEQQKQLREKGRELRETMRGPGERGGPKGERGPKGPPKERANGDARKKMQEKMEAGLSEVLSTSQLERLKQIHLQQVVKIAGPLALVKGQLGEDLGITDEQRESMKEKGKEARKAMKEKMKGQMKEAKLEAQQMVMSVLTSEQQQKLAQMQGEPFDLELPNHRMQRRGGPEGREGADGPRRRPGGEGRDGKQRGSGKKKGGKRPGPNAPAGE